MTANTNSTAYGYVNTRHFNRNPRDTRWFATKQDRDSAMQSHRARAVRDGLDEGAVHVGIYPIESRMNDRIADAIEYERVV